ncbi:MAG: hypothetical protein WD250_11025 [Egibacteraceae bacterium]
MKGLSRFGRFLWEGASSTSPAPSLSEAVRATVHQGKPAQFTFATVVTESDDVLAALVRPGEEAETRRWGHVGVLAIESESGSYVAGVWPARHDGVFHLVGVVPVTSKKWSSLERRVARSAPVIVPVILNQADFDGIVESLAGSGRVEVSRLNFTRITDGANWQVTHPHGLGPRPSYEAAVSEITDPVFMRTAALHIDDRLHLHLRRQAGATYYSGDFELFEERVLGGLADAASRRMRLLADRQRNVSEPAELNPVTVRLSSGLLKGSADNQFVVNALLKQPSMGVAVFHGNPYLHIAVTDYLDGSNFDAFVTTDDEVIVYPGFRSSLGSLTRLTDFLSEHLGGVEVAAGAEEQLIPTEAFLTSG